MIRNPGTPELSLSNAAAIELSGAIWPPVIVYVKMHLKFADVRRETRPEHCSQSR